MAQSIDSRCRAFTPRRQTFDVLPVGLPLALMFQPLRLTGPNNSDLGRNIGQISRLMTPATPVADSEPHSAKSSKVVLGHPPFDTERCGDFIRLQRLFS